jgi:ribosome-associated protein YbcJ (S4-like RNA binding protein)
MVSPNDEAEKRRRKRMIKKGMIHIKKIEGRLSIRGK